LIKTNPFTDS